MLKARQRYCVTLVIKNEDGVAIVAVLLILMLLTFVGITATNTTISEKKMVRSKTVFDRVFLFAESGAMEGIQLLADATNPLATYDPTGFLVSADPKEPENYLKNIDGNPPNPHGNNNGQIDKDDFSVCLNCVSEVDANKNTFRLVVQLPIQSGDSLALGSSRVYSYASFGYSENSGGRAMIDVGYRKRF